jgi:hypothetical protein
MAAGDNKDTRRELMQYKKLFSTMDIYMSIIQTARMQQGKTL